MKPIKIIQILKESDDLDSKTKKEVIKAFKDLSSDLDDPYSVMCSEPGLLIKEGIRKIADKYFNGDIDKAYNFYYYELDESDDWDGDTTEYYGGTYPDPPEDDDDKPTQEEIDDYYADIAYEESRLNESINEDDIEAVRQYYILKDKILMNQDSDTSLFDRDLRRIKKELYQRGLMSEDGYPNEDFRQVSRILRKRNPNSWIFNEQKQIKESSILEEKPVYMNTWKNYNEYGADLVMYNNIDGWMTIDDALEFCKKYAEDEPFINDTDGVPIEISDYDNPVEKLEQLKKIEDANVDKDVLIAFLEEGRYNDIDEIIEKIEDGDYIFYEGVDNQIDLAQSVIDDMGFEGVSHPEYYIDRNKVKDMIESTYDAETLEQIDLDQEADDMIDSYVEAGDKQFIEDYFDYNSYGNELAYDYTFTSTGALRSD